jgi:catechol 2,3-dioxygenase-like lactoylglutathione lyase family enzyme
VLITRGGLQRRDLLAAGLALPFAVAAPAGSAAPQPPAGAFPGWHEAVVIVPDPAPWIETLTIVGGRDIIHRSAPDQALNRFWSLPAGARTEQVLMRNPLARTGSIRLVRVWGAEQRIIRPDDMAWEAGGVQALDVRVVDMESTRVALHSRGWRAPSEPVRYKTYGLEVIQWAPTSPDGVRLSFIQRIAPPLVGWAELKRWGHVGNAAVTVADLAASRAFFAGRLGMTKASSTNTVGGDGPNVMGLPWAYARRLPIEIEGYRGAGAGEGSIELISMPDAAGRDFAAAAHPPNLGIAALRCLTDDARTLAAMMDVPVTALDIAPYGACLGFVLTGPDGVRLEVFQAAGRGSAGWPAPAQPHPSTASPGA